MFGCGARPPSEAVVKLLRAPANNARRQKANSLPGKGELGHQIRRQRLQLDRDHFDAAGEVIVGDEIRDGNAESDDGAVQRLGDAIGDHLGISVVTDITEDADESGESAKQSEQRGDAGRDLEKDESGFEARDLVAGAGLDGIEDLGTGPVAVLEDISKNTGEGGGFLTEDTLQRFGATPLEVLKGKDDLFRKGSVHLDHPGALQDDREREDGKCQQDEHEESALDEKFHESGKSGEDGMHGISRW